MPKAYPMIIQRAGPANIVEGRKLMRLKQHRPQAGAPATTAQALQRNAGDRHLSGQRLIIRFRRNHQRQQVDVAQLL